MLLLCRKQQSYQKSSSCAVLYTKGGAVHSIDITLAVPQVVARQRPKKEFQIRKIAGLKGQPLREKEHSRSGEIFRKADSSKKRKLVRQKTAKRKLLDGDSH